MVWQGQEGTSSRRRANRALGPGQHHRGIPTVIVDHSALFRAGLTHMLSGTRFRVVEDRARLQDIPKSIFNHHVSLVLVGLNYAGPAVLSELSLLKAEHEDLRIVIFSDRFDLKELLTTIAFGADCYLLKHDVSLQTLLQSLELVLLGETVLKWIHRTHKKPAPSLAGSLILARLFAGAMEYPRPPVRRRGTTHRRHRHTIVQQGTAHSSASDARRLQQANRARAQRQRSDRENSRQDAPPQDRRQKPHASSDVGDGSSRAVAPREREVLRRQPGLVHVSGSARSRSRRGTGCHTAGPTHGSRHCREPSACGRSTAADLVGTKARARY